MPSRVLLETAELAFGEFECPPGDPLWNAVNANIGARPHVVFPRTHVVIAQQRARPVLCTPNHVVYYGAHQLYRRRLRDARGDRCLWLEADPDLFARTGGRPDGPAGPGDAGTFLLALALARHLREQPADRLTAEEAALRLLERALCHGPRRVRRPARARTRGDHDELVEAAKDLLAGRIADPPALADLARALHVSPFHLARTFRALTGYSPGSYVHGLRLRAAVDRLLADPDADLTRLALELGYCSPSHFTDRFRTAFGRPPSAVRGAQARTIMEAARALPA